MNIGFFISLVGVFFMTIRSHLIFRYLGMVFIIIGTYLVLKGREKKGNKF